MAGAEIDQLIARLAKLPGLGPRSARRAALALLKSRQSLMAPLIESLRAAADNGAGCAELAQHHPPAPCARFRPFTPEPSVT